MKIFKQKGITLIEILIGLVIASAIFLIALPVFMDTEGRVSVGINGLTESRCIENYKFIIGQDGNARQILDEFGKGVRCYPNPEPGKPGSFGKM